MSTAARTSDPVSTRDVPLPTPEQLPDDLGTLKNMMIEVLITLRQERRDNDALRHRVSLLLQRVYGPRRERFHPDQPLLFAQGSEGLGAEVATAAAAPLPGTVEPEAPPPKRRRCKPHGRRRLSADLPRRLLHHELSEAERLCICGQVRVDIGAEVSEQLDWQPASLFVWQHLTHKYVCTHCGAEPTEGTMAATGKPSADTATTGQPATTPEATDTAAPPKGPAVVAAVKPTMPIAKGLPGPGLLAQVIVSKYFDHLPLYRQERIFGRQGVFLPRSTTCDWMAACADLLRPLYDLMVTAVVHSLWLHTDDTPVKNLAHAAGSTATARFWIYWGDRSHPYNVFDFTLNRKRDGPERFLADFHGYLHADAFSGYDALYLPQRGAEAAPIVEVACNAHARRKFHEARGSDAVRAHQALGYYRQLYELERGAATNQFDDEQRWRMRQDFSVTILEQFHGWLEQQRPQVLPKSPMAEALGYALNNWTALRRYTEAGFLSIDNNVAEREMKRIAIGRKNWLFVGSEKGGRTAAVLFSFTSTCHRLGIEPWAYLQDVLTRLPGLPAGQLEEVLPDRWQAARTQAAAPTESRPTNPPPNPK